MGQEASRPTPPERGGDASALASRIRSGGLGAVDALDEHLARLDALTPLNAVVARDDEAARRRARELDEAFARSGPVGVLHGVPFTVKDWIDAAGLPCVGEGDDRERQPARDATVVARLRAAGAVLMAKTNVGVDHPVHGPCHHPVDPARSPGGSSSGEAVVVASGASPLGIGSDSGGSIRLPAAWCGAVGFKPSYGLVPTTGHYPRVGQLHDGRTVVGPLTRSARDAWLALGVLAGPDGHDPGTVPMALGDPGSVATTGLRVADLGSSSPVEQAVELLRAGGAAPAVGPPPSVVDDAADVTRRYWRRSSLTGPEADQLLLDWDRFRRRLLATTEGFDVVVSPVVDEPAPRRRPMDGDDYLWTLPWSLTGWPAMSLPWGTSDDGLPLAIQLVAPAWQDHVVVAVAAWLEAARQPA